MPHWSLLGHQQRLSGHFVAKSRTPERRWTGKLEEGDCRFPPKRQLQPVPTVPQRILILELGRDRERLDLDEVGSPQYKRGKDVASK